MALTAAPVPGNTILAAWGTEIRNRTTQVFNSPTEINAWPAPNGSIAIDLSSSRLYVRLSGTWRPRPTINTGFTTGTTNPESDLTIGHGLGFIPNAIVCTPSHETNNNSAMVQITAKDNTTFTCRVRNYNGIGQASTVVGIHWMVSS